MLRFVNSDDFMAVDPVLSTVGVERNVTSLASQILNLFLSQQICLLCRLLCVGLKSTHTVTVQDIVSSYSLYNDHSFP